MALSKVKASSKAKTTSKAKAPSKTKTSSVAKTPSKAKTSSIVKPPPKAKALKIPKTTPRPKETTHITIIGAGTIGLSFTALHLNLNPKAHITIYDTRPDLQAYMDATLPAYLSSTLSTKKSATDTPPTTTTTTSSTSVSQTPTTSHYSTRLTLAKTLNSAVAKAHYIQEQGPENASWKQSIWRDIEAHAPATAILWTSTSGIPASTQTALMKDKTRLLVVHPYNPPHIMPLLEIVPSPVTAEYVLGNTMGYWQAMGRTPVVLKKECTGFVANRLAFALFREACSLVHEGVIGVQDLDDLVTSSMGPRWAVQGPFQSYHAGGGEEGLKGFMAKIGDTVRGCWDASEEVKVGGKDGGDGGWEGRICEEAERVYRRVDTVRTARLTKGVLEAVRAGDQDMRRVGWS